MAVDLKEFLAQSLKRVAPTQYAEPVITDVLQQLRFVLDLTPQAKKIEWLTSSHTLAGAAHPRFDFPVVPADEIHIYRHIGISNSAGAGNETWEISALYPAVALPMLERYTINTTEDNLNILTTGAGSSSASERNGRPWFVYPAGTLRVERSQNGAAADVMTVNVVREVIGGPLSAQIATGIVASEI